MSRPDHVASRTGCPADVSHGAVRVIEVEVIATAGSAGPRDAQAVTAGPVTHLGGTNELMTRVYETWLRLDGTGHRRRTDALRGSMWLDPAPPEWSHGPLEMLSGAVVIT